MSTIIYLYHTREPDSFVTEKWRESDYCLIRLGIPALLWQSLKRLEQERDSGSEVPTGRRTGDMSADNPEYAMKEIHKQSIWSRLGNLSRRFWKQRGQNRTLADTHKGHEGMQEDRQDTLVKRLLGELQELQTALGLLGDNPYQTYCVYEDFLWEKIDTGTWRQHWNIPEFNDYNEYIWVEKLMKHAVPGHYMILGYADCLPEILCENARKLRSVKWFLRAEQYTQKVQEFMENFYEEYGLAVEIHLLKEGESWLRVRPSSVVPVNILDFAGEEKISACDVAKGSIWLDMDSMDGKNRRIETRNPGISYFSMKKQWKQQQKEPIYLDTINKNRYNT